MLYASLKFSQTSYTLSWTLYCLATNPGVQEKLRRVVEEVVGSDELVTPQHIARVPFINDCIRESQRYNIEWSMFYNST
jgi:cytochrome P450